MYYKQFIYISTFMSIINRKKFKTDYDMFASDNYIVAKNKLTQLFKSKVIEDRIKIDINPKDNLQTQLLNHFSQCK